MVKEVKETMRENKSFYLVSLFVLLLTFATTVIVFLPNQFTAEINDTVGKTPDTAFNFIIYTDIHHDPAYEVDPWRETLDCIQKVNRKARIAAIWNLGDIINGYTTTKAEAIAQIREVTELEDKVSRDFHRIPGNRDNNIQATYESNTGYSMDEVLTVEELKDVLFNNHTAQEEDHSLLRPTDYYVDFPELRVVCLSAEGTTFQQETAKWMGETALDTELPVLILSHIPTRPEWGFHNDVQGGEIIETELKSFVERGGTVICYIHGHDHGDMISAVTDENGEKLWSEVAVACSRFHVPQSNGTPGMTFLRRNKDDATMVVFDVVSIDLEKRAILFIRFGAGEDRKIEYR